MYLFLQIRIGKQNIQIVIIFVKRLTIWMTRIWYLMQQPQTMFGKQYDDDAPRILDQ